MNRIRAEELGLMIWNPDDAKTAYLSEPELNVLEDWADGGRETGFIARVKKMGLISDQDKKLVRQECRRAKIIKAPLRSFYAPESLHIELTTKCPLSCPQCYKGQAAELDLDLQVLKGIIDQAADMKVFQIALGGGEPLCYQWLKEAVAYIGAKGMVSSVTTSGVGLDPNMIDQLKTAGLNHLQISLNGSSEAVNRLSRDSFYHGVHALKLLSQSGMSYGVNWVARMDNIDDLPDFMIMIRRFGAQNINILRYKPAAFEDYQSVCLTTAKYQKLVRIIKATKQISVKVDSAYSNLLCHLNQRAGRFSGCGAGRRFLAIDAAGNMKPCSHVEYSQPGITLKDYWYGSMDLELFRKTEEWVREPCQTCRFLAGCRGCRAIAEKQYGNFYEGDRDCDCNS